MDEVDKTVIAVMGAVVIIVFMMCVTGIIVAAMLN